jgi:hypothetical protein
MIEQVQQLTDRAAYYGREVASCRNKASRRFRQVATLDQSDSDSDFAYMNPGLDNWDSGDSSGAAISQALSKDFGCLNDMYADDALDLMIETIGKMRAAGATRAEMDNAWSLFNSAQS